jgi:ATP-dependent DNA ligase
LLAKNAEKFIADGEVVFKSKESGKIIPFQEIERREQATV